MLPRRLPRSRKCPARTDVFRLPPTTRLFRGGAWLMSPPLSSSYCQTTFRFRSHLKSSDGGTHSPSLLTSGQKTLFHPCPSFTDFTQSVRNSLICPQQVLLSPVHPTPWTVRLCPNLIPELVCLEVTPKVQEEPSDLSFSVHNTRPPQIHNSKHTARNHTHFFWRRM